MRNLLPTLGVFVIFSTGSVAWSQSDDPFRNGQAANDPFGGNPVVRPQFGNPQPGSAEAAPKRALIDRTKRALANGRQPVVLQKATPNDVEARIHVALDSKTTQTFIQTPLSEALQTLSDTHDVPIVIDRRGLEEIGLAGDEPVTLDLRNVTLRSFLRLMLRDLELTYLVKDEVMQITTISAAESNLVIEMYVLPKNLAEKSDQVIKVLTSTVVPETWETLGGPSTALAIDHVLVLSTTDDVHDQAQKFLEMLIEKYGDK